MHPILLTEKQNGARNGSIPSFQFETKKVALKQGTYITGRYLSFQINSLSCVPYCKTWKKSIGFCHCRVIFSSHPTALQREVITSFGISAEGGNYTCQTFSESSSDELLESLLCREEKRNIKIKHGNYITSLWSGNPLNFLAVFFF